MSTVYGEIPLLPLPAVLFPGTFLPVQISESTQRTVLHECVGGVHQIGVMLQPGERNTGRATLPCITGCLASVTLVLTDQADQPVEALLYGEQRIRVVDSLQQETHLSGTVEILDDVIGPHAARRSQQASEAFEQYLALVRARFQADVLHVPLPDDPTAASYLLASVLHLPQETKQRWLETASVALRLEEELAYLHNECEKLSSFLALAQRTRRQYFHPNPRQYVALFSQN